MTLTKLPKSEGLKQSYQAEFGGLNHRKGAADGEIYDMYNMTSDHYPVLSPREKRRILGKAEAVYGIHCYGDRIFIAQKLNGVTGLYLDGDLIIELAEGEKEMAVVSRKLIVFPDKVFYDLNALETKYEFLTKVEMEEKIDASVGDYASVDGDLYYWSGAEWILHGKISGSMDSAIGPNIVSFEAAGELNGSAVKNNALRIYGISSLTIEDAFSPGDAVEISGCTTVLKNNKTAIIREIDGSVLYFSPEAFVMDAEYYEFNISEDLPYQVTTGASFLTISYGFYLGSKPLFFRPDKVLENGGSLVWNVGEDKITYNAPSDGSYGQAYDFDLIADDDLSMYTNTELKFVPSYKSVTMEENVTIRRVVPDMDHIFSVNNRLWGAKGDTIYGSALGDPINFNKFDGVATDSYSTQLGTAGDVTAIVNYNGYPTFFKEDGVFKLYGYYPSAFQIYSTMTLGVKKGCSQSAVIAGEVLYYISKSGVMAYTGSVPQLVGDPIGKRLIAGVAGTDGRKYYLSATDGNEYRLYVYDTFLGLWHVEDDIEAVAMSYGDSLVCGTVEGEIFTLGYAENGTEEGDIEWMVQFADSVVGSPNQKGVERAQVRADCSGGGYCDVYISFDGEAEIKMGRIEENGKYTSVLPIVVNRGDSFRLILRGKGIVDIYGLSYSYYHGSERR